MVEGFRIRNTPRPGRGEALQTPVVLPIPDRVAVAPATPQLRQEVERLLMVEPHQPGDIDPHATTFGEVVHDAEKVMEVVAPVAKGSYWAIDKVLTPIETGIKTFAKKILSLPIIRHIYNLGPFKSGGSKPHAAHGADHGHGH